MQDLDLLVNHHFTGQNGPSVLYNAESHLQVLFQMHASVWSRVLPFCILNCIFVTIIHFYDLREDIDFFSMSDSGHVFMSLMVSYLTISRLNNSLNRYMDGRKYLSQLMSNSRELIQQTIAFTRYGKNRGDKGMEWRVDVSKRLVSLLRVIVGNLQKASTGVNVWEQRGLTKLETRAILLAVGHSNERAPYVLNIFLRSVIALHVDKLEEPLEVVQELQLLKFTSKIIDAYGRIMKDVNTPYPFPLVQMTRTMLFIYIFSLPLALLNDIVKFVPLVFVIFFLTYGFIGIELIAIEMDDPYGDDDNDFNVQYLASVVYNDIAVFLYDIDGKEAVDRVRRVVTNTKKSSPTKTESQTKARRRNRNAVHEENDKGRRRIFLKQSKPSIVDTSTLTPTLTPIPLSPPKTRTETKLELFDGDSNDPLELQNNMSEKSPVSISRRSQYSAKRNEIDLSFDDVQTKERGWSLEDPNRRSGLIRKVGERAIEMEPDVVSLANEEDASLIYESNNPRASRRLDSFTLSHASDITDNSCSISIPTKMMDDAKDQKELIDDNDDLSFGDSESSYSSYNDTKNASFGSFSSLVTRKLSNESNSTNQKSFNLQETSLPHFSTLVNTTPKRKGNPHLSIYSSQFPNKRQLEIESNESMPLISVSESESPKKEGAQKDQFYD